MEKHHWVHIYVKPGGMYICRSENRDTKPWFWQTLMFGVHKVHPGYWIQIQTLVFKKLMLHFLKTEKLGIQLFERCCFFESQKIEHPSFMISHLWDQKTQNVFILMRRASFDPSGIVEKNNEEVRRNLRGRRSSRAHARPTLYDQ